MFYEFAMDPCAVSSWERARFFLDAFGPWKGRFLADYPKKWKRRVYENLSQLPEVEKKRIEERLRQLDKRVFSPRAGAPYDPLLTWLENAEAEHARQPFRAIISDSDGSKSYHVDAAEVDERCELWRVQSGQLIPRDPPSFAQALQLLFSLSRKIVLIDPYFRADQDDKTQPLVTFCKLARKVEAFEIHFSSAKGYDFSMQAATRALPRILPDGMEVSLHCWSEKLGGPRLHNRFILTDIAGVKFGDGIEMGNAGQEDHLSILDEPSRTALWEQFLGSPPSFVPAGSPRKFVGRA